VVYHDSALPGLGPIIDLTLDQARSFSLPNGERVPTLAEALELLNGLDVWVEVKGWNPKADGKLLDLLLTGPTPRQYAIHSFDHRIILRLGNMRPELSRGILLASYPLDPIATLRGAGADTLWENNHLSDQDLVNALHAERCRVIAWTANDEAEISRLAELGVDGICGNYPDRIRSVVERKQR
jgi:glycerophosphoryl diester phosphodiesterase